MSVMRSIPLSACALAVFCTSAWALTDGQNRFFDWSKSMESEAEIRLSDAMNNMLKALDGCILPQGHCVQLVAIAQESRNAVPLFASLNVLAVGMDGLVQSVDCEPKRRGFPVTSTSLTTSDSFFVVMTSSSNTSSECFIRKVGIE